MNIYALLVEDDLDLAASLIEYLELEGVICDHAANGVHGLQLAREYKYDVIMLDRMLPKLDGLSLCASLRRDGLDVPVLMITARDTLDDKVEGFESGSDDYLVKPFALKELLLRVQALAKRRSSQPRRYVVGDLAVDMEQHEATRAGIKLSLSPKEWALLEYMAKMSPNIALRDEMQRAVWGEDLPESNSLKVHMHKLRQKVDKPFPYSLIKTVPGVGFVLREPSEMPTKL
ncbi:MULTISPECIES: response regulator transcription factor [unclassified Pseudodesulfovibrio]|uniref:response regulator transcription factor n=1 Tax=unclassified Pseudodesulfovibrio TaxID=2661612 RepID=UPI000FEBCE03|nr:MULTISPECIES: response regulator transcription factor [unclassified Pseudodesulfovibrio]MCJ2163409.1 response regulator transcription factor [Pseudodesulfovibrio sp. S3-i]RWU06646.1 DNA-binding response regulator [Pseudodesulfovibrio sp. S3]